MSFLNFLKKESNMTYTENGAVTYRSSESACLDLFYRAGALRNADTAEINAIVDRAFIENSDLTMKTLFFARDVRGGLGERRFFRIAMAYLAKNHSSSVKKNLALFSEYGRWDDLTELCDFPALADEIVKLIKAQLNSDTENMYAGKDVSLLAKWLPSVNTSSEATRVKARKLAKALGISEKQYRKSLSSLRRYIDIIENRLRERDYTFDYGKEPSRAMFVYRKAFIRNDGDRYRAFIASVNRGEIKMNADTLYPYDIVRSALKADDESKCASLNAAWRSLPAISDGKNAIAVIDGSGSMYYCGGSVLPVDAALSLGIYFAEHSTGAFANHFITFSMTPRLVELKGKSIVEKVKYAASFNECANTNIQGVFDLILSTAVKNKLAQSELPETIYIISDMEFDYCVSYGKTPLTNFEAAKRKFANFGYKLPNVIFWNVASRNAQIPVKMHESGAALVSGFSPKIFEMVKSGDINPYKLMTEILYSERYAAISA